jgi:hypothetical protein
MAFSNTHIKQNSAYRHNKMTVQVLLHLKSKQLNTHVANNLCNNPPISATTHFVATHSDAVTEE